MNETSTKFTTDFVRRSWINIWKERGYFLLESASLIPRDDSSLLWINSGVAAVKKFFVDPSLAPSSNLVNCQKVIRTADLSNINAQACHQTLFEMLGAFSFGGNFKKETIPVIWEWLTSVRWLGIDPKKFFITVLPEDKNTYEIWKEQKIVSSHIIFGNRETNFWDMGDGPCGPCTEIFFDFHQNDKKLPQKISDLESKRFLEIGNIVFSEYYHQKEKSHDSSLPYLPLTQKCVDFGGGLERIVMILQGKNNTFETDYWIPIIQLITQIYRNNISEKK